MKSFLISKNDAEQRLDKFILKKFATGFPMAENLKYFVYKFIGKFF